MGGLSGVMVPKVICDRWLWPLPLPMDPREPGPSAISVGFPPKNLGLLLASVELPPVPAMSRAEFLVDVPVIRKWCGWT